MSLKICVSFSFSRHFSHSSIPISPLDGNANENLSKHKFSFLFIEHDGWLFCLGVGWREKWGGSRGRKKINIFPAFVCIMMKIEFVVEVRRSLKGSSLLFAVWLQSVYSSQLSAKTSLVSLCAPHFHDRRLLQRSMKVLQGEKFHRRSAWGKMREWRTRKSSGFGETFYRSL